MLEGALSDELSGPHSTTSAAAVVCAPRAGRGTFAHGVCIDPREPLAGATGCGLELTSARPSRRRRVHGAWIPQVTFLEGKLPKARRVRSRPVAVMSTSAMAPSNTIQRAKA